MRTYYFATFIICFLFEKSVSCQVTDLEKVNLELKQRGEIYFAFYAYGKDLNYLSKIISIDNFINDSVYAYANTVQFEKFKELNIPFRHLIAPSLQMHHSRNKTTLATEWDYPSYDGYLQKLADFSSQNPSLCSLIEFGMSENGKKLLAVKISDNVNLDEEEPEVFYTAGIHGDEGTGVVLMLNFIAYLIKNYGEDEIITDLLNNSQVYINPLSNPDGFYFLSDSSNYGAKRFNSKNIDLNRNFPDPQDGEHPDGNEWQTETIAMMDFMKEHNFILSANFHDGAEVVNYPWDTWEKHHPDNDWFFSISRAYADTVHKYNSDYFIFFNNGITNGYQWYEISGGRQDYVTYFLNGREVTIELSEIKSPESSELATLWNYNKNSLVNYLLNCLKGIKGMVVDSQTGQPLKSNIFVLNHDYDNSNVYSSSETGVFYRMISPGNYSLSVTSEGYMPKTINVNVPADGQVILNIDLLPDQRTKDEILLINPVNNYLQISFPNSFNEVIKAEIFDLSGRLILNYQYNPYSNTVFVNVASLKNGFYVLRITGNTFIKKFKFIKE